MKKLGTYGLVFGHTEAEGEGASSGVGMLELFKDYLDILPRIEGGKFIVVGRKGVGKSSIAQYLEDFSNKSDISDYSVLHGADDFKFEKLITGKRDDGNLSKIKNQLFEWIILCSIANIIVKQEHGIYTKEFDKLNDFLQRNRGFVDINEMEVTSIEDLKSARLSIQVLRHAFEGIITKHLKRQLQQASFIQMISPLKEIVNKMLSYEVCRDMKIRILFDDLDLLFERQVPTEDEVDSLYSLVKIARDYNVKHMTPYNVRVVLFMRDDIMRLLIKKYPDTAKIFSSYKVEINWYSQQRYNQDRDSEIPLKRFVEDRIEIAFREKYGQDCQMTWNKLFSDSFRDSFKYVLDYTFYRPRDMVLFLNRLGEDEYRVPIDFSTCNQVLRKYVEEFINELRNELTLHFKSNEIDLIFDRIVPKIFKSREYGLPYTDLVDFIMTDFVYSKNDSESMIDELLRYGILGLRKQDNRDLFYAYREEHLPKIGVRDEYEVTLSKAMIMAYRR